MSGKVFFIRHQAAGLITKYAFANYPTQTQIDAVSRECFQQFGAAHPKTGETYFLQVVESVLLSSDAAIDVPERALNTVTTGSTMAGDLGASGFGHVRNP